MHSNVNLHGLPRYDKYRLLTTEPSSDSASYPRTRPYPNSSDRQFQPSWMKHFSWLHYSRFVDGTFCHACILFSPSQVCRQELGQFVASPFRTWNKMIDKAKHHASKEYHRTAVAITIEFLARFEDPSKSIDTILDAETQRITDSNQKVIESLLRIVLLCGKQGLALRGHRDDRVNWEEEGGSNEGNFIQLVRFRAETDAILADHLAKAPKNAQYTSKTIQNEMVSVIGDKIRSDILKEVRQAQYYSIIAEEVTDSANKEELSLVIRYVHDCKVKEVFVDFLEVERITGKVLGDAILKWLKAYDIPTANMRGQCYDGTSNMSGARSGVKSVVQGAAPKAMYYHCVAQKLNLSVVSACRIPSIKNAESYVGEMARFFSFSAKRQRLLDKAIEACDSSPRAKKLKDACRTRWIERIDSYAVFLELLSARHMCLQAMVNPTMHSNLGTDWSWDGETITKANGYLYQFQSSAFIVAFQVLLQVLQLLRESSHLSYK